jgi:hypothetical protein
VVSLPKLHNKKAKGPKQEPNGGSSSYSMKQRERTSIGDVVGLIGKIIALIHHNHQP